MNDPAMTLAEAASIAEYGPAGTNMPGVVTSRWQRALRGLIDNARATCSECAADHCSASEPQSTCSRACCPKCGSRRRALADLASSPAVQRIRDVIDSLVHEVGPYGGAVREDLGDHLIAALRDVLAHRCAPAAPEIVTGAEAAELPVEEACRVYGAAQRDDLRVRGSLSEDLSAVLAYVIAQAPVPPIAVGDTVTGEQALTLDPGAVVIAADTPQVVALTRSNVPYSGWSPFPPGRNGAYEVLRVSRPQPEKAS